MILRGPRPSDDYTTIHTPALADGTLSFKARGVLAYLLSRPAGSEVSPNALAKSGTDGERAVTSGLKELTDAGYLIRTEAGLEITDTKGVGFPTPQAVAPADGAERLLWLVEHHPWLSPAAIKTAHREIELQELPLSITRYEIRCKEMNKAPTSGEWLRWTIDDEQKLRLAERERAREAGQRKSWYETA